MKLKHISVILCSPLVLTHPLVGKKSTKESTGMLAGREDQKDTSAATKKKETWTEKLKKLFRLQNKSGQTSKKNLSNPKKKESLTEKIKKLLGLKTDEQKKKEKQQKDKNNKIAKKQLDNIYEEIARNKARERERQKQSREKTREQQTAKERLDNIQAEIARKKRKTGPPSK